MFCVFFAFIFLLLSAIGTKVFVDTRFAIEFAAFTARPETIRTVGFSTLFAIPQTAVTDRGLAIPAIAAAFAAVDIVAEHAGVAFILAGGIAALIATDPIPFIERDVGTAGVVGRQDVFDQSEKVTKSTLFQR